MLIVRMQFPDKSPAPASIQTAPNFLSSEMRTRTLALHTPGLLRGRMRPEWKAPWKLQSRESDGTSNAFNARLDLCRMFQGSAALKVRHSKLEFTK